MTQSSALTITIKEGTVSSISQMNQQVGRWHWSKDQSHTTVSGKSWIPPDGESATIMWLFLMVTWVTATSRSQKRKVGTKTDRLDSLRKLYGNVTYVIKLSTTENLLH